MCNQKTNRVVKVDLKGHSPKRLKYKNAPLFPKADPWDLSPYISLPPNEDPAAIIESFASKRTTKYDRLSRENKARTLVHYIKMGPFSPASLHVFWPLIKTKHPLCFTPAPARTSIHPSKSTPFPLSSPHHPSKKKYFLCF